MKEYIEREALMDEIHRIGGHNLCEWDTIGVKALVCRQPAADVVEVVRCYECKYWESKNSINSQGICMCGNKDMNYCGEFYPFRNDFCSYGERKMDGKGFL